MMGESSPARELTIRKSDGVRVHHEKNRDRMRVLHEKERWRVRKLTMRKREKERWDESLP